MKIDLATEAAAQPGRNVKRSWKASLALPVIAVGLLLSGCVAGQRPVALGPIGPAPTIAGLVASTNGSLVVFSLCEAVPDLSAEISGAASDDWQYSNYKILSRNGKVVKSVQNNSGAMRLQPRQIELPVGQYIVVARAAGGLRVSVPVIIKGNQTTVLHLDGGNSVARAVEVSNP